MTEVAEMRSTALEELQSFKETVARLRTEMRDTAQRAVKEGAKAVFEEYGDIIDSFGWTQYTPYFNDGEPCEYSMGNLSICAKEDVDKLKAEYGDDWEDYRDDWDYEGSESFSEYRGKWKESIGWKNPEPNPAFDPRYAAAREACKAVYDALSTDDLSKSLFGNHVQVRFTPDEVVVEDYDHE